MHGLNTAFKVAGYSAVTSCKAFWGSTDQRFDGSRSSSLNEARNSERPFTRLLRPSISGPPQPGQCSPAYAFASRLRSCRTRSALDSLPRNCGEDQCPEPVARLRNSTVLRFSGSLLPFRTFRPFRSLSQSESTQKAHLLRHARSPFAPQRRYPFEIATGSSFPVRYVSPGSLFPLTSWNHHHDAPKRRFRQGKKRI